MVSQGCSWPCMTFLRGGNLLGRRNGDQKWGTGRAPERQQGTRVQGPHHFLLKGWGRGFANCFLSSPSSRVSGILQGGRAGGGSVRSQTGGGHWPIPADRALVSHPRAGLPNPWPLPECKPDVRVRPEWPGTPHTAPGPTLHPHTHTHAHTLPHTHTAGLTSPTSTYLTNLILYAAAQNIWVTGHKSSIWTFSQK